MEKKILIIRGRGGGAGGGGGGGGAGGGGRAVKAAGMHPIMVPDLAKPTEEMERLSECILPSLHEVKKYLENK